MDTASSTLDARPEHVDLHYTASPVLWAACAFAAILGFSRLAYGLLLPAMRETFDASYRTMGLIGTVNFVAYFVGTLLTAPLSRRLGRRRLLAIGLTGMSLAIAATARSQSLLELAAWRALVGVFSAPALVMASTLPLEQVRPKVRGQAAALIFAGGSAGIAISGFLAPSVNSLAGAYGWRWSWLVLGLAGLLATIGSVRTVRGVSRPAALGITDAHPPALQAILAPGRLLWLSLSFFGFGLGYLIFGTFFPALLQTQGLAPTATGYVWGVLGCLSVVGVIAWGRAFDRWPTGGTLGAALALQASGALLVASGQLSIELIGAAAIGLTLFAPPPLIASLVQRGVPAEQFSDSFAYITAIFSIGQILGPALGGEIVERAGLPASMLLAAVALGGGATSALLYRRVQHRHAQVAGQQ